MTESSRNIILVPNQRLAQHHKGLLDASYQAQGLRSWDSVAVYALENWLHECWQHLMDQGVMPCADRWLLSGTQEIRLWRDIVQGLAPWMLSPESAADEIAAAYRYAQQWNLDFGDEALRSRFELTEDSVFFMQCADRFEQQCESLQALPSIAVPYYLSKIEKPFEESVQLLGFEELTPAIKNLCCAWNISLPAFPPTHDLPASTQLLECEDEAEELVQVAQWAADILAQANDLSVVRIAIVVPGLESRRDEIEYALVQVFDQDYQAPASPRHVLPFNITAGQSLLEAPLVAAAVNLLQLNSGVIDVAQLPALLYSPFLVLGDTLDDRLVLENHLRDLQDFTLQRSTIMSACSRTKTAQDTILCPDLLDRLQQSQQLMAASAYGKKPLAYWQQTFEKQLQIFGWPGSRALDSIEYQQLNRWYELWAQLPNLQLQAEDLSWQDALALLKFQLAQTVFQPQSRSSPLQIMGPLEAAGLPFTHLCLMSADDRQFPPLAAPNPYLPLTLQRELSMPHSSPERELLVARRLLSDFCENADNIVFSYARKSAQNEVQVSPLLRNLEAINLLRANQQSLEQVDLFSATLPVVNDAYAPELTQNERLRGGVRILENQAICPFKAYAEHRLQARALSQPQRGISALLRGNVAHLVMELVWQQLGDQASLLAHDSLEELLAPALQQARAMLKRKLQARSSARLVDMEIERLRALALKWLQHERGRAGFTVRHCEYELQLNLFGRPQLLRIDRVDELADGSVILIDYKTGAISLSGVVAEKMSSPQLPVYALYYQDQPVSGVALARLDNRAPEWAGLGSGAETGIAINKRSKVKLVSFDELKVQWQEAIQSLEQQFIKGHAAVSPAQGATSCRYCQLQALCRVSEIGQQTEPEVLS